MAIRIASGQIQDSAVTNDKLAGSISSAKLDLTGTFNFSSGTLRAQSPSADSDVAIKSYVDAIAGGGVYWKEPVRVASTANIDLSSALVNGATIDGVTVATGDRILVKNQSTASQNGIYDVVASGAASRSSDCDTADELNGAAVFVKEGSAASDQGYIQTATVSTIDSDTVTWAQFTGLGQITAGAALSKSANTLNVEVDDTGIEISGDALQLKDSGVTNAKLAGSISNDKLANSTISGVALGGNLSSLSPATNGGVLFTSYNGSAAVSNLQLDLSDLADASVNVATDSIAIYDSSADVSGKETIADVMTAVAGDALSATSGVLAVSVDDVGIEINSDALRLKDAGVTNAKLQNSTISGVALGSSLNSLSPATNGGVLFSSYNGSAAVSNLQLDISDLSAGAIDVASDTFAFYDSDADATSQESIADLMTAVAGDALSATSGVLAVSVDDVGIEINSDAIRLKDSGVTNAKLAGSISTDKLSLASEWETLSPTGSTATFDLSDALNVNLANIMVFRNGLAVKQVASGPADTDEYTVSPTGGAGGVARLTFGANVAASDDLRVWYLK